MGAHASEGEMDMTRMMGLVVLVSMCLFSRQAIAAEPDTAPASAESVVVAAQLASRGTALPHAMNRPALLPALYATFGAIQAWDVYSTSAALTSGGREANPVTARAAGHTGQMIALKAATSASTIYFAERIWRRNRVMAVVLMVGINSGMAAIALHNTANARAGR
jgi:Domain of unknown function (DUF5658)